MELDGFLTTTQAAERLGVSQERARQFCASGRLAGAVRLGRDWVIPVAAVEGFQRNPRGVRLGTVSRKAPRADGASDAED